MSPLGNHKLKKASLLSNHKIQINPHTKNSLNSKNSKGKIAQPTIDSNQKLESMQEIEQFKFPSQIELCEESKNKPLESQAAKEIPAIYHSKKVSSPIHQSQQKSSKKLAGYDTMNSHRRVSNMGISNSRKSCSSNRFLDSLSPSKLKGNVGRTRKKSFTIIQSRPSHAPMGHYNSETTSRSSSFEEFIRESNKQKFKQFREKGGSPRQVTANNKIKEKINIQNNQRYFASKKDEGLVSGINIQKKGKPPITSERGVIKVYKTKSKRPPKSPPNIEGTAKKAKVKLRELINVEAPNPSRTFSPANNRITTHISENSVENNTQIE